MPDGRPNNQEILAAKKFQPGQSGNPGGRPKSLPHFRRQCRLLTWKLLAQIRKRMKDAPLPELVAAFEAVADRGGYLTGSDQGKLDTGNARLVLALLGMELTGDQRDKAIAALERAFKGEDDAG